MAVGVGTRFRDAFVGLVRGDRQMYPDLGARTGAHVAFEDAG